MSPPIVSPRANEVLRRKLAKASSCRLSHCPGLARSYQQRRAGLGAEDASVLVPEGQTRSHIPRRRRRAPTCQTSRIEDHCNGDKSRKRSAKSSLSIPFLSPPPGGVSCRATRRVRWAKVCPRHSLGLTPYRLALCLFQWPTGLADGFGLKETTLPATGRIHPGKWVPRSPARDSASEPPTVCFWWVHPLLPGESLHDSPQQECTNRGYLNIIEMFCQLLLAGQFHLRRAWPPAGLAGPYPFSHGGTRTRNTLLEHRCSIQGRK